MRPNTNVVMMTTPMCSGLICPTSVNFKMIGMKMMMAGTASMKSPTTMNSSTSSSMIIGPLVPANAAMWLATRSGPRRYATIQPKADAPATAASGSEYKRPAYMKSRGSSKTWRGRSAGISTTRM